MLVWLKKEIKQPCLKLIIEYNFFMTKDYIIWTPAYDKSNGVKILHLLYKGLEKKGFKVFLYSSEPYSDGYDYIDKITTEMKKNSIVIYPEIVEGNPLRFKNVVRFVLNYPGKLGGREKYHKSEIIFTHFKDFHPDAELLTIPWIDETVFYNDNSAKVQDCVFVYKGGKFRETEETKGLLEINMDYPQTQNELAELLRKTGTLYSYDNCSSLLDEAFLCGAKVKIVTQEGIEDYNVNYRELINDFDKNFQNFINVTQNMDYKGLIEKPRINLVEKIEFAAKYLVYKYILKNEKYTLKYKNKMRGF